MFSDISDPDRTVRDLVHHNVSVAAWAGYYDSGSIRSAARVHNKLLSAGASSVLVIGPWTHGARACWTPAAGDARTAPSFSLDLDLKRFFDCQLRDKCWPGNDVDKQPLRYFLTGGAGPDEWRGGADGWPPTGAVWHTFEMCSADKSLREGDGTAESNTCGGGPGSKSIEYHVDPSPTSGRVSRWNLVLHIMKMSVTYPNRHADSKKSLVLSSTPLAQSMDIVGSVQVGRVMVALVLAEVFWRLLHLLRLFRSSSVSLPIRLA